jgi:prevent-host-death family protein
MSDYKNAPRRRRAVGVRELKAQAARIVREVREEHASYVVTHRGEAVAALLPLGAAEQPAIEPGADPWKAFLDAGRRLEGKFKSRRSGVKLLSESRR